MKKYGELSKKELEDILTDIFSKRTEKELIIFINSEGYTTGYEWRDK